MAKRTEKEPSGRRLARFDDRLRSERGVVTVGGVDEAGRGALAGPVAASIVVLGPEAARELSGVDDSKKLKPGERAEWVPRILAAARGAAVAFSTAAEVDRVNVLRATLLAARRAIEALDSPPGIIVADWLDLESPPCPVISMAKADATSLAAAAASILAKTARDRAMELLDAEYPGYGFARHKGYGVEAHREAIASLGVSTIHRATFAGAGWFGEGPSVFSVSFAAGAIPARRPALDPLDLLRGTAGPEAVFALLPEMEFQAGRRIDRLGSRTPAKDRGTGEGSAGNGP